MLKYGETDNIVVMFQYCVNNRKTQQSIRSCAYIAWRKERYGSYSMSREEVFEKLNEVFRDVFDDDSITVTDATTANDIEEWDSLEHINLLAAIEQEFGMKFSMGQVVSMKNVGEMADIIMSQIG